MEILQSVILGVVQGFSEFLPISSSGHLILVPFLFNWKDPGLAYDVALHMGTLLAVLVYFWKDWVKMARQLFGNKQVQTPNIWYVFFSTFPAAIAGLLLNDYAEHTFRSPLLVAINLIIFGVLLAFYDSRLKKGKDLSKLQLKEALMIGCAQALAIFPGVSRSGVTITMALALGFARSSAIRFSFLLSAPIIAGAGVLKSKHILMALQSGGEQSQAIVIGFLASLLSGLVAVFALDKLVRTRTFIGFSIYRLILGVLLIVLSASHII